MSAVAPQLLPKCTHCNATQIVPEWSENVNENEVAYFWRCMVCGHEFETRDHPAGQEPSDEELAETFLPNLVVE
jgi:hypothetical protein